MKKVKKVKVFRFAFGADGIEMFHLFVEGKNKIDAEKRIIRNLHCHEQISEKCSQIDLEIDE